MRRFFVPFVHLVPLLLALGCGGATSAPNGPTSLPVGAVDGTPSGKPTTGRHASEALTTAWPMEAPRFALYADLDGLLKTKVIGGFVNVFFAMVGGELTAPQRACMNQLVPAMKELAVGGDDGGLLILVRFDPAAVKPFGRCLEALGDPKPASFPGALEAWRLRGETVALAPGGLVLVGSKGVVTRALAAPHPHAGASLKQIALQEGEYVAWTFGGSGERVASNGTLLVTDEMLRLAGHVDFPDEDTAKHVTKDVRPDRLKALFPESGVGLTDTGAAKRLIDAFHIERDGARVIGRFELRGAPADQVRDLGTGAALGVYAVRKYISNAKQAEAKNSLGQMAKDLATWWEMEDGTPMAKKKLASYPPVPKAVPRGVKYMSSTNDWKPWAPLRFEMGAPQYYQYEIIAAKDGESAEIIARGDLNGDGKTSQFKILVKVDRATNSIRVAPSIHETDPDE